MSQITIRNLEPYVEDTIRHLAEKENRSLNEVCTSLLEKALNINTESGKKRDLSSLAGSWTEEDFAAFEKSQEPFEAIDEDIWR